MNETPLPGNTPLGNNKGPLGSSLYHVVKILSINVIDPTS